MHLIKCKKQKCLVKYQQKVLGQTTHRKYKIDNNLNPGDRINDSVIKLEEIYWKKNTTPAYQYEKSRVPMNV